MPNIAVTGASGFIGRRLCQVLKERGHCILAIHRNHKTGPWEEECLIDLTRQPLTPRVFHGVDTIYHLAGKAHAKDNALRDHFEANCEGTRNLICAAEKASVRRIIFFSTIKVMGEFTEGLEDEKKIPKPVTPYGQSKLAAERLVLGSSIPHRVVLRPALVYGESPKGNLERMLKAIQKGIFPPLPKVNNKRTLVHIEDLVQAALLCAVEPQANGEIYIVTDGLTYSTRSLYEIFCHSAGKSPLPWGVPVFCFHYAASLGSWIQSKFGLHLPWNQDSFNALFASSEYSSDKLKSIGFKPKYTLYSFRPRS